MARDGELVEYLDNNLWMSESDLLAALFQEFIASEARNGLGQYLTPLPVADLIATVVAEGAEGATVLDPFCGVGLLLDRVAAVAPGALLRGIEINEPIADLANTMASITRHAFDIVHGDAFQMHLDGAIGETDVVVANPPFGAVASTVARDDERIPEALRTLGSIPAELLGLEVCVDALRPNGALAIVLPQSVLTNRSWAAYRRHLATRLALFATVSLPEETFSPFRGVASSCVLFGRRVERSGATTSPHWVSRSVGYDANGRATGLDSDLAAISKAIVEGRDSHGTLVVSEDGTAEVDRLRGALGPRLDEVADVVRGKNPPASAYASTGAWLLKVGDLSGSVLPWRQRAKNRVSPAWFAKQSSIALRPGDICMTAAAHRPKYIGLKVDLVDEVPTEGACPSGEVIVVRLKDDAGIEPEQLLFYFRSAEGYDAIQDIVRGSTGHLYPRDLANLRLPILERNDAISKAIKYYKDAVDANRDYRRLEDEAYESAGLKPLTTDVERLVK
jgi:predicted RNA methylase